MCVKTLEKSFWSKRYICVLTICSDKGRLTLWSKSNHFYTYAPLSQNVNILKEVRVCDLSNTWTGKKKEKLKQYPLKAKYIRQENFQKMDFLKSSDQAGVRGSGNTNCYKVTYLRTAAGNLLLIISELLLQ